MTRLLLSTPASLALLLFVSCIVPVCGQILDEDLDATTATGWLVKARRSVAAGDLEAAADCFDEVLAREPDSRAALIESGVVLAKLGRTRAALSRFLTVILADRKDRTALFNAAQAYEDLGEKAKALAFYERLAALDPDDWQTREMMIRLYQSQGRLDKVKTTRNELLRIYRSGRMKGNDYVREHFSCGDYEVIAIEKLSSPKARTVYYEFYVYQRPSRGRSGGKGSAAGARGESAAGKCDKSAAGDNAAASTVKRLGPYLFKLVLGSFEEVNDLARKMGRLDKGARLYHFDRIDNPRLRRARRRDILTRRPIVTWNKMPTYMKLRKTLVEYLRDLDDAL